MNREMTMSANCPVCCEGHIVSDTWLDEFEYKCVTLNAFHTEEFCNVCGTLLQSPETIRANVRNKQRAKNAHDGLLTGDKIRQFRDSFDITQKLAALLFGGGEAAFAKYEADEIAHNKSMDRLLRLCIAEPKNISLIAKEIGISLPHETIKRINAAENKIYMATITKALSAFKESESDWYSNPAQSANDNIFEAFMAKPPQNHLISADWALKSELIA
jgi:putative zinc finger/helix-turn-helix YgiT family protein